MAVTGATPAERPEAREAQRRKKRIAFHFARIRSSRNGRERLENACAYARAVGDDLPDDARTALARAIVALADERNQP